MIIELNTDLAETPPRFVDDRPVAASNKSDIHQKLALGWNSTQRVNIVRDIDHVPGVNQQLGLIGMLSYAYSHHVPVAIAPHDVWFVVMTQMSQLIEKHQESLRSLFTDSDDKKDICIQVSDPTDLTSAIPQFEAALRRLVPSDVSLFVPEFSTHTEASRLATVAAFMDGVKVFYSYMMFACGIPSVKILGTVEDWDLIRTNLGKIQIMFNQCGVDENTWFDRVIAIAVNFILVMEGHPENTDWWKNIFSQKNEGSGGQKKIDGWIIDLFLNNKPALLESFEATWAVVPFKNLNEPELDYRSFHGAFQSKRVDGFLTCDYGSFTIALEERTEPQEPQYRLVELGR